MLTYLILFLAIIAWQSRPVPRGEGYYKDYMTPERTTATKGVFILLIFLTHGEQYLTLTDAPPDKIYSIIRLGLGQSVVTAFFFYSGYGMTVSLRRKGEAYLSAFPRMRILKTLLHFDIAVLLYLIAALAMQWPLTSGEIIWSFIGWESLGNSSWFIFDILVAYVMFYACFRLCRNLHKSAVLFTALSIVFVVLMVLFQESRYYNTFLSVSMGIWFCLYQEKIERGLHSRGKVLALFAVLAAAYVAGGVLLMPVYDTYEYLYIPLPLIFMTALLLLTMVWRFDNPVLRYFGEHLFSVFILMRLPMELLEFAGVTNVYVFMALSLLCTVALAHVFDLFLQKLDQVLFKPR